jgi:thiol-disulfide isomerase/thioredoxin
MRHLVIVLIAGSLCLVGALAGGVFFLAGDIVGNINAREITGSDLDGKEFKLSDHRGKVVLLVFWTSTDPETPAVSAHLKQLESKFGRHPFRIVGVNVDESHAAARSASFGFRSFYDGSAQIARQWGVMDTPTYVLIDHKGNEAQRYNLFLIDDELEEDIMHLLRDVPGK